MESQNFNNKESSGLAGKLEKTKSNSQWLSGEINKMRSLNPRTEYMSVLNSFQLVAEGIEKVKETLDPIYDNYVVVPKKIVGQDKINQTVTLVGSKRDEGLKRYESKVMNESLGKLFNLTEKDLQKSEHHMNHVYKQV